MPFGMLGASELPLRQDFAPQNTCMAQAPPRCAGNRGRLFYSQPLRRLKVRYPSRISVAATASTVFLCCFIRLPEAWRMPWASTVVRRSSQSTGLRPQTSSSRAAKRAVELGGGLQCRPYSGEAHYQPRPHCALFRKQGQLLRHHPPPSGSGSPWCSRPAGRWDRRLPLRCGHRRNRWP